MKNKNKVTEVNSKEKYYETKEFAALDKVWKQKLKDSGFNDIEDPSCPHGITKKSINTGSNNFIMREVTESYYDAVNDYLHNGTFAKESDKQIWELYANGLSLEEIKHRMRFRTIENVRYHIKKIKKRLKLR